MLFCSLFFYEKTQGNMVEKKIAEEFANLYLLCYYSVNISQWKVSWSELSFHESDTNDRSLPLRVHGRIFTEPHCCILFQEVKQFSYTARIIGFKYALNLQICWGVGFNFNEI